MENQNNSNQDCGCSDGCCAPQKKGKLWSRIVFIVIIVAAATIVTIKLTGKQDTPPADCCETAENPSCC
ncbi:MAG: hypothetical protein LBC84_10360 [Prevotellaceae bacterium]|jgi:hypothetical protein|nr:hypothetical protein [Prevotellaceae bacterium]